MYFSKSKNLWREASVYQGTKYDLTAGTERALIEKVAARKLEIDEGRRKVTGAALVREWGMEYLEAYRQDSVSDRTYRQLCGLMDNWIVPVIGNMRVRDVKPIHCQRVVKATNGMSKSHIDKLAHLLRSMFGAADDNGMTAEDPTKKLEPPKGGEGTHRALEDEERIIFMKVCERHRYGLWGLFMLNTGAGPGETCRIKGKHLDFEKRRIFIDGTKHTARKRWVPMTKFMHAKLSVLNFEPEEYLFKNEWGYPLKKHNMRRRWARIIREMNIEMGVELFRNELVGELKVATDLTAYCLRHTFCTDLEAAGVPINIARRYMGHLKVETTAKIYTHATEEAFARSSAQIDELAEARAKRYAQVIQLRGE
jgi:integrase